MKRQYPFSKITSLKKIYAFYIMPCPLIKVFQIAHDDLCFLYVEKMDGKVPEKSRLVFQVVAHNYCPTLLPVDPTYGLLVRVEPLKVSDAFSKSDLFFRVHDYHRCAARQSVSLKFYTVGRITHHKSDWKGKIRPKKCSTAVMENNRPWVQI